MVQVVATDELNELMDSAASFSMQRGKYFVGVEHLFEAIVAQLHALPVEFLSLHEADLERTQALQQKFLWQGVSPSADGSVVYTPPCAAIMTRANRIASRMNSDASAGHALLALLSDAEASPCQAMDAHGIDRRRMTSDLKDALLHEPRRSTPNPFSADRPVLTPEVESVAPTQSNVGPPDCTRDLTEEARQERSTPAIGRGLETLQLLEVLTRQGKNNVILVGEAGTGKTRIVEGLAAELAGGKYERVVNFERIIELNIGALISGAQDRGLLEQKLQSLLRSLEGRHDTVVFIDEFHLIMGAGSTEGDSGEVANLLKAALSNGTLRVIGATTMEEYRRSIERDPDIERRFQMVRVEPLDGAAILEVLQGLKLQLERKHRVRIHQDALETAIALTDRYMPNRNQPGKAIEVMDQSCARARIRRAMLKHASKINETQAAAGMPITSQDIRKVVSQIASVPLEQITAEERVRLTDMEHRMRKVIVGQDHAIAKAVAAVKTARAGLDDPKRPDASMLFLGPTGVGKTQLAKELARLIFGSPEYLVTFNMSDFVEPHALLRLLGAPPGQQSSDREGLLAAAVRDQPYSVLLFDEIEKAHPRVFDVLLPVLDEGQTRDYDGRLVSFRNCIIIFTSDIAVDESAVMRELRSRFPSEFIDRIDEIVPFYPLLCDDVRAILKKMVDQVRRRLRDRSIGIRMYQRAYEHLAKVGYNGEHRAGELQRAVERHIAQPLAERLREGTFTDGDMIDVLVEADTLVYRKGAPHESA